MAGSGDFKGKYIHLWVKDPMKSSILEDPRVVEFGGRTFLVGEYVGSPDSPQARDGCTQWVPIDDVLGVLEYPNRDRVLQVADEWKAHKASERKK